MLKNIQKEMKIQIILATHSQEIIDECEKDEIIVIEDEEVLKRKEKNTGDTSKSEMTGEQLSLEFQDGASFIKKQAARKMQKNISFKRNVKKIKNTEEKELRLEKKVI